jgi:hypothetical protein
LEHPILSSGVEIGSDGRVTSLTVSFDSAEETQKARAAWRRLTRRDQEFIMVLIMELPNLIHHLCEQNPDLQPSKVALIRKARAESGKLSGNNFFHNLGNSIAQMIS